MNIWIEHREGLRGIYHSVRCYDCYYRSRWTLREIDAKGAMEAHQGRCPKAA